MSSPPLCQDKSAKTPLLEESASLSVVDLHSVNFVQAADLSFLWLKEVHLENTLKSHSQPLIHSVPWQLANHALIYPQERHTQVPPHLYIPVIMHAFIHSLIHPSFLPCFCSCCALVCLLVHSSVCLIVCWLVHFNLGMMVEVYGIFLYM